VTRPFYESAVLAAVNGILSNPERSHMTPFKVAECAVEVAQQVCRVAGHSGTPGLTATAGNTIREVERKMFWDALKRNMGDKHATAKELGVDLRTIYHWLDRNVYESEAERESA
jgi:transcriptional regulator with PAS, ATPase and Fis domain